MRLGKWTGLQKGLEMLNLIREKLELVRMWMRRWCLQVSQRQIRRKEEELRQKMLKKLANSKQQLMDVNKDLFMEDIAKSNVCYDDN